MKFLKNSYFKSIKWGVLSIGVTFLNQILLIPVLLTVFDKDIFAIWIILNTIVLLIRAINLGQLNYSSNIINLQGIADKNKFVDNLKGAFSSNIKMIVLQVIVVIILSNKTIFTSITDINKVVFENHLLGWCLLVLALSKVIYQFFNLYVLRLLEPFGEINKTIKFQVIGEFLDFSVIIISCLLFKNLFLICVSSLVMSVFYAFIVHRFILVKGIRYYFRIDRFGWRIGFSQILKSKFLTISFILEKFFEVGLNFIVTITYSLSLVPVFNTTRVMANMAIKVSNIIAIPLMPSIQKSFSENNQKSISKSLSNYWSFSILFIILVFSGLLPFIKELFNIWTQNKIVYNQLLFILILIAIIIQNFNVILVELVKKTNQTKFLLLVNFIKFWLVICFFIFFGNKNYFYGLGYSIIMSEVFSILIFLFYFRQQYLKLILSNLIINLVLISNLVLFHWYENLIIYEIVNLILILIIVKRHVTHYIKRNRLS